MTYMVPFDLALPPDEQVTSRGLILSDEQDIPDDSYQFQEWYCPDPDCDCFQGLLEVFADHQKSYLASVYVPFNPALAPFLNPKSTITPTALALLKVISEHLQEDPAYLKRLRDHYWLVRRVAMDRTHPAHAALTEWTTAVAKAAAKKPRRKKR
jgi:hypothetical protein